jgi:hypothetical protein
MFRATRLARTSRARGIETARCFDGGASTWIFRISQIAFYALTGTSVPFRMSPMFLSFQALTQLSVLEEARERASPSLKVRVRGQTPAL